MRRLLLLLALAGCTAPPPDAYYNSGGVQSENAVDLGNNTVGERCVQAEGAKTSADIYCGVWQQPSARVRAAGPADAAGLGALATSSTWRANLDTGYVCAAPRPVALADGPALQLDCTRRAGGWPHVAVVALSGGQAWFGDGVTASWPAIQRSITVLSGRTSPTLISSAALNALQAQRQGAQARATGDERQADYLLGQGLRDNLADEPGAAESDYRRALAVQEKALGADNPSNADLIMRLALQLSNLGRYPEAEALFARADRLAPLQQQLDPTLGPRLKLYEGRHALNRGQTEAALASLRLADAGFVAVIPPSALTVRTASAGGGSLNGANGSISSDVTDLIPDPLEKQTQTEILGLAETRRYEGLALRRLGRTAESDAALRAAATVAQSVRHNKLQLLARIDWTSAEAASSAGDRSAAIDEFRASNEAFARAFPGSRPLASVELLRARELVEAKQYDAAIPICRASMKVLLEITSAFEAERMAGCLEAFAAAAAQTADAAAGQALLRDMFLASQLVQGSTTSQQIQQSSARLAEGSGDPKVGEAIRAQQDAKAALDDIRRRQEAVAEAIRAKTPVLDDPKALEEREHKAEEDLAARESDLQAAAPNYGQLVQQATKAEDVLDRLKPDEAFAQIVLTPGDGWTFVLHDKTVQVARIKGGAAVVDPLVTRIRSAMTPDIPAFDTAASQALFADLFGDLRGSLEGVRALTVAPGGSLLSLPFAVLLTGPADPSALGAAPWLTRRMAIGHVPSAGNFVALRKIAGTARAPRPWFGFGDFQPVTLAQARRSFGPACGDSAELLATLPPLPSAQKELAVAARLMGAAPGDELIGAAFTAPAVQHVDLAHYRVVHFATHALLPSDLKCQDEPALVTSAPRGALDAAGSLLTASELTQIKLDADVVILSACNSGGAEGKLGGGESLSALARSFFYGGARSLLITHWEVDDQAATFTIADTLRRMQADPSLGTAAALQQTQAEFLNRAGASLPAQFAHPFYWAPFALIGQASSPGPAAVAPAKSAAAKLPARL